VNNPARKRQNANVYPNRVRASRNAVPRPSQPAVRSAPDRYHVRYRPSFQPPAPAIASTPEAIP
jgi:hypothetical protein